MSLRFGQYRQYVLKAAFWGKLTLSSAFSPSPGKGGRELPHSKGVL
jgi:hypothetical protein